MDLSNFLLRQKTDNNNSHEIIPISFTLKSLLGNNFYQIDNMNVISQPETNKYLVQTRSQKNLVASKYWKYTVQTKV